MPLLDLRRVNMQFGGLRAVKDLDMAIEKGMLYGLIGPNGAGKTTIFNVVTGVYKPTGGEVRFEERVISGLPPYRITDMGVARTFQNIRLFSSMTVLENVMTAFHHRTSQTLWSSVWRGAVHDADEARIEEKASELLGIFKLGRHADELAVSLPYGSQRRLEIARAMATEPKLLCLDEPAAGMNTQEALELMDLIRWVRDTFGMTILLVEHNMQVVMGICERIQVVDYGETIALGLPATIRSDPKVIEAYLGGA